MVTRRGDFRLAPRLQRWLRTGEGALGGGEVVPELDWDGWLLRRMSAGRIVTVGGVLVDRDVLEQRFACVSDRCAPRPGRGSWRSCCADVAVSLDAGERRRLATAAADLPKPWREGDCLARPGGRCALSEIDARGRIRCRLHAVARRRGVGQSEIQPLSCRLFPLIVLDFGQGRVALTLVSRTTSKLAGSWPARRYPCLADPGLPQLFESMEGDLDWAFGEGFARALSRA